MAQSTETQVRWILWVVYIFLGWIIGIIQIYGIYRLYSMKHLIIVQKRYPKIVFCEAVITVVYMFFSLPWVNKDVLNLNFFEPHGDVLANSTYPALSHGIATLEATRLWLIYFDLNHLRSLKNEAWKAIIDKDERGKDWFLINKPKYGNMQWVASRVVIYYIIIASLLTFLFVYYGLTYWTGLIDGFFYGIPLSFTFYVYYKCPNDSTDCFLFQYEFKASCFFMCIAPTIYISAQIVHYLSTFASEIMMVFVSIFPSSLSLLSTVWIPHKIYSQGLWKGSILDKQQRNEKFIEADIAEDGGHSPPTGLPIHREISVANTSLKLLATMKNLSELELFIDHIFNEFSSEMILSFVEFIQYKKYLTVLAELVGPRRRAQSVAYTIEFDQAMPKSTIVFAINNDASGDGEALRRQIKTAAYLLYKKYIEVGCQREVNIRSHLRKKYKGQLGDKVIWMKNEEIGLEELVNMFEPVVEQMFFLISQCYCRYLNKMT